MIRTFILTMSDRGARGEREDASGREIVEMLDPSRYSVIGREIIPDEFELIVTKLSHHAGNADLILTTGGTGLSPRDVTPEATAKVIDREVPGIAEAMRAAGLAHTKHAMLSRAVAGCKGRCLIVNLPGSTKAVRENLAVILDVIPHAVEKLQGSQEECAR